MLNCLCPVSNALVFLFYVSSQSYILNLYLSQEIFTLGMQYPPSTKMLWRMFIYVYPCGDSTQSSVGFRPREAKELNLNLSIPIFIPWVQK